MKNFDSLTLGQVLEKSAAESPDKVAVVDGGSRKTYSELNAMADALAAGLADIGYNYLAEILKIKKELPELESIIVAGNGMGEGVYSFEALMDKGSQRKVPAVPIDPQEDLCMLLYTSGTTGQPKGAMITHYELESLLIEHPKIHQICVVPTPNPVLGESICVCVIPNAPQRISLEEIREFMKDKIAPHKLPDELCIMDDFPKLSGGVKIKKFGEGGLTELAQRDQNRERFRK